MTNRALIIIDLQNDYYPGGKWSLHNIETASSNAEKVLAKARSDGDLVIHIHHEFLNDEPPFFAPNSQGAEIHQDVQPLDTEIRILKHKVNAFQDTDLKAQLDQHKIDEVTIIGAMSHMCIDAASRAASDFGYSVTVIEDACAARELEFNGKTVAAEEVHSAYMSSLSFAYAAITTTETHLKR